MNDVTKPKKKRPVRESKFCMSVQVPRARLTEATIATFEELRTAAKVSSNSEAVAQFVEHVVRSGAYSTELAEPSAIPEIVVEQARAAGVPVHTYLVQAATIQATADARRRETSGGASTATEKIAQLIIATKAANVAADSDEDKREITVSFVQRATGCNRNSVARYMSAVQAELDEHHAACKIQPGHNHVYR